MMYSEEELLSLSGIQHFRFCRRQWALIHLEQQWQENERTADGRLFHEHAHDPFDQESRGDCIITRGVNVFSFTLGVSGQCDVVEYHRAEDGIPLKRHKGFWQPYPVEYKRGKSREDSADALQLCAQAMCLEEMLCCDIPEGALFYGETHRRTPVTFSSALRQEVRESLAQMHALFRRGQTPKVKPSKSCNACSLKSLCLPTLMQSVPVSEYLRQAMEETR